MSFTPYLQDQKRGVELSKLCFHKPSRWFCCALEFERCCTVVISNRWIESSRKESLFTRAVWWWAWPDRGSGASSTGGKGPAASPPLSWHDFLPAFLHYLPNYNLRLYSFSSLFSMLWQRYPLSIQVWDSCLLTSSPFHPWPLDLPRSSTLSSAWGRGGKLWWLQRPGSWYSWGSQWEMTWPMINWSVCMST